MSHAPCTLFWPRSGLTPLEGLPTLPVNSARLLTASTLSVPCVCWVMPMAKRIVAGLRVAYSRAASTISARGTPVICSAKSSVNCLERRPQRGKVLAALGEEGVVGQPLVDDDPHHAHEQSHVGSRRDAAGRGSRAVRGRSPWDWRRSASRRGGRPP